MRAALIATIREAPADDAPRLVAADWFEEQGGQANAARAEFIRTQIERANLPPDDIRQSELQAHELRLLKRWAPVWCGCHFVFKKVRFRRGFIEYVHLHLQHFLHHRRQMLALEPVRDIRLTGWFRAADDLVRRVARCKEWQYIETLRIHHQGPHHDPRSNLILLLESPHLTRLRALHGTRVQFDADARRRFERLPILCQVRELVFPNLDILMLQPGEWFSDGGATLANQWKELKSLTLPYYLRTDLLRRLTEMPFWDRLTAIALRLSGDQRTTETFSILRDRLPSELQKLRLSAASSPDDYSAAASFFGRLAQAPLQRLTLHSIPIPVEALDQLLDATNRWDLRELSLSGGGEMTEDHARIIAGSPGVKKLHSLDLSGNWNFDGAAARTLFSSEHLRSLVHLNLSNTRVGSTGAKALAVAPSWDRLRSFDLSGAAVDREGLRTLLASTNLTGLVQLHVGNSCYDEDSVQLDISPDLAAEMMRLPHLATLCLHVRHCDVWIEQLLSRSDRLAWVSIDREDEDDIQTNRAKRAPERCPPVDDAVALFDCNLW